jgi:hypothetical protein
LDEGPKDEPLVAFYQFIPNARPPQRADRSAAGTMPTRAYRFCEAMRSASAFAGTFSCHWFQPNVGWRF